MRTVGELVFALLQLPQDTRVVVSGTDCGGYDACWKDDFSVKLNEATGLVEVDGDGDDVGSDGRKI